jgi:hypothetical protein
MKSNFTEHEVHIAGLDRRHRRVLIRRWVFSKQPIQPLNNCFEDDE